MGFVNFMPGKCSQKGIAMVELAVTLPFILLILIITAETGYLLYQQNTLSKSVETGGQYLSFNTRLGTGLVKVSASTIQTTRNLVMFGNVDGNGTALIDGMDASKIAITCTYGAKSGYCNENNGIPAVTLQATHAYMPILGPLFDNVTGFNLFPVELAATSVIAPI